MQLQILVCLRLKLKSQPHVPQPPTPLMQPPFISLMSAFVSVAGQVRSNIKKKSFILCVFFQEPSATPAFVKVAQVHAPPVRPPSISSATAAVPVAGPVWSQVVAPGTGSSLRFATHTKKVSLTESLFII